jgi:phospholipase C
MMENQNWNTSVAGNFTSSNAPYIMNTIIPSGATANNYEMANSGPSEPNYKWIEAGSDFNQTTDDDPSPSNSSSTTQHLATYLNNAGISWKAYIENIDGAECPLVSSLNSLGSATTIGGGSANYYAKHNPFVFFDDLTNNLSPTSATCISHIRPYSELATDLAKGTVARYNFISPNGTDDMHDTDIKTGDTWLSQNVPAILGSSAYQNNGALIIMWDESANDSGTLPFFVLSPLVKSAGYSNSIKYSHSSTLLTLQEIFGVGPCLADACNATDLSDLFLSGVI